MKKNILADIEEILKGIEEAYPKIPELSRAEVAALRSVADERPTLSLGRMQQDPSYKDAVKQHKLWRQHLKTVISVNEQAFEDEPTPAKKKQPSSNKGGRPQEYDPIEEAKIAMRWSESDGSLTKKKFAAEHCMNVHEFDKLLRRVRARESRERAKH